MTFKALLPMQVSLTSSLILSIRTWLRIHEHVSLVFQIIKSRNMGEKNIEKREQRQEELKLDKEIWIHISSLIHAAKQSQSWTESKRISAGGPQES